jgi:cytochrome c biogenesis protein CcmG/thiol:disulfide interchange protein DsbE
MPDPQDSVAPPRARGFLIPVLVFLVIAGIFAGYLLQISSGKSVSDLPSALIDKPVPGFTLPGIGANDPGFSSDQLKGQVSLVNVWASWCPPCRVEHPVLMRLASEGVPIFGINFKDKGDAANQFLEELGNPFIAIGADQDGRVAIDWGVYGYPETFVIDTAGQIRYRHVGAISADDLDRIIYPLLKKLGFKPGVAKK